MVESYSRTLNETSRWSKKYVLKTNIFDLKRFLRIWGFAYCLSGEILANDWVQILITFRRNCYHCGKEVPPGRAFWSDIAKAAKHLKCKHTKEEAVVPHNISDGTLASRIHSSQIIDLSCYLCGGKTGCQECSFLSKCDHRFNPDEYCICTACSSNFAGGHDTYEKYKQIFLQNVKSCNLSVWLCVLLPCFVLAARQKNFHHKLLYCSCFELAAATTLQGVNAESDS